MTHMFDGREFAKKLEQGLLSEVQNLKEKQIVPRLVSILVGDNPASVLYVNLKKKAAERIGCELLVVTLNKETTKKEIIDAIRKYNNKKTVTGIMVQLPLPENFSRVDRDEILDTISVEKDVDGLREQSKFTAPTAKAVLKVFQEALMVTENKDPNLKVVVVGASGFEGSRIVKALRQFSAQNGLQGKSMQFEIIEVDSKTNNLPSICHDSDVIISVTGVLDLIKADIIKDGAVLIDVGSPKGDIEKEAYEKASFVSPVPGGVGPITIMCLLENLVIS